MELLKAVSQILELFILSHFSHTGHLLCVIVQALLKGLSRGNYDRLEEMKERADGLRSAREEKRKLEAEEKLYQHFQENNPDIRKVASITLF